MYLCQRYTIALVFGLHGNAQGTKLGPNLVTQAYLGPSRVAQAMFRNEISQKNDLLDFGGNASKNNVLNYSYLDVAY